MDRIQYQLIKWLRPAWNLSSGIHIQIENYVEWLIYKDIFIKGEYDQPIKQLLSNTKGEMNVLDLGANVGFFIFRLAHLFRVNPEASPAIHVAAVEGSPSVFKMLNHRLQRNNLGKPLHIKTTLGLVGEATGTGEIYLSPLHGLNSTLRKTGTMVKVPFVNLVEATKQFDKIHLLKCDIEGSELAFMKNYPDILQKTEAAVFEFHPELCDSATCQQLMKEHRFSNHQILNQTAYNSVEYFWK